jgi:hypothetical protein
MPGARTAFLSRIGGHSFSTPYRRGSPTLARGPPSRSVRLVFPCLVLPGAGNIFADVGRVVFDADGNIIFEAGPHQFLHGDVASLCAAMADP